jgi:hypothetical protein
MVMQRPTLGLALAALACPTLALAALGLGSCSATEARTQLMLVADTNIPNLGSIEFEVSDDTGRSETAQASMLDDGPATLAVVPSGDDLGPLRVTARAMRNGLDIERSAVVSFVRHQTRVVELHLVANCIVNNCSSGETCTENGCRPEELSESDLPTWSGEAPTLDAGARDAGADATTDGGDGGNRANCGADAASVDLDTDINHCGSCDNVCKAMGPMARNTQPVCNMGQCGVECRSLWGDCDGNAANGCERALTTDANCGMCDMQCPAASSCFLGSCR